MRAESDPPPETMMRMSRPTDRCDRENSPAFENVPSFENSPRLDDSTPLEKSMPAIEPPRYRVPVDRSSPALAASAVAWAASEVASTSTPSSVNISVVDPMSMQSPDRSTVADAVSSRRIGLPATTVPLLLPKSRTDHTAPVRHNSA